jgi:hypothetical protein
VVAVRLTAAEKAAIATAAQAAGLSPSGYLRNLATGAKPTMRRPKSDVAVLSQLLAWQGRVAGSLNQLAKRVNTEHLNATVGPYPDSYLATLLTAEIKVALNEQKYIRDSILSALRFTP